MTQVFPAQANNLYIFPAVGHAAVVTRCRSIPDAVFLRAAEVLASLATRQELQQGRLFPPLSSIREVQAQLCAVLAEYMVQEGLGQAPEGLLFGPGAAGGSGSVVGSQGGSAAGGSSSSVHKLWLRVVQQRMFSPERLFSVTAQPAAAGGGSRGSSSQGLGQQQVPGGAGSSAHGVVQSPPPAVHSRL